MYVLVILGLMRNLDKKVCAQVDEDDENGVNEKKPGLYFVLTRLARA